MEKGPDEDRPHRPRSEPTVGDVRQPLPDDGHPRPRPASIRHLQIPSLQALRIAGVYPEHSPEPDALSLDEPELRAYTYSSR